VRFFVPKTRKRIDVLFSIGSGRRGGAEIQSVSLAKKLSDLGLKVHIAFMSHVGPLEDELLGTNVTWSEHKFSGLSASRFRLIPSPSTLKGLLGLLGWWLLIWREKPKIAYLWLETTVALGFGVIPMRGGIYKIAAVRGEVSQGTLTSHLYRRGLQRADKIVYNSQILCDKDIELNSIDSDKCQVIGNGLVIPAWKSDVTKQPPSAIVVANFKSYKGHETLVKALALTENTLTIVLCGAGEEGRQLIKDFAEETGVLDHLVFPESPIDVELYLQAAQFAIHPSDKEGLSNAILEELAAGLPVVACQVGGNPELIQHGVNGLLIPPSDASSLARAIDFLIEDPEAREKMSQNAKISAQRFSWNFCVEEYLRLFNEAADVSESVKY